MVGAPGVAASSAAFFAIGGALQHREAGASSASTKTMIAKLIRLRIDDLEVHVDIDRQLILELHDAGALEHDHVKNLRTALQTCRVIGETIGIIMTRRFVTQDQAFTLLQRTSNNTNCKLRDVAEEIVLSGEATTSLSKSATIPFWTSAASMK